MASPARIIPLIVASALFMENMDSTVIATSLPAIAADLGTDPIVLKLAFTTYLLSLTIFIPISGWFADRFGAKHVFRAALGVFMLGSIACGFSQSLGWLIAARALQGVGGAMMVPVGRIIILRTVSKPQLVDALAWLTIPEPILDLRLLRIQSFRASIVGGSFLRIGVGAILFLMPLMFQLGFGFTAFQSGLLTCFAAAGAIAMKFSASRLLRRFGFRKLLVANGIVSCGVMAAYGLLTAMTPFAVIALLLLIGGFLRSLQFTALNALSYADIDRNDASKATSL